MNSFRKPLTVGETKIDVEVDREIVAEVICKFPNFYADLFDNNQIEKGKSAISEALRNGSAKTLICMDIYTEQIGRFALPLILKKANPEMTTAQSQSKATEIYKYCEENKAKDTLSTAIFEFITEGFSMTDTEEPQITVTIG